MKRFAFNVVLTGKLVVEVPDDKVAGVEAAAAECPADISDLGPYVEGLVTDEYASGDDNWIASFEVNEIAEVVPKVRKDGGPEGGGG